MTRKKYRVVEVIRGIDNPIYRVEYQALGSSAPEDWYTSVYRGTFSEALSAIDEIRKREVIQEKVVWSD